MQTVIETGPFIRDAGAAGMTEDERFALINFVGANPDAGDVIKGSGGCRKVRFAKAGTGKSGGYRVITFYSGENVPVFLLTVYAKGRLGNLTDKQVNVLKGRTKRLLESYGMTKGR
ncbi:MAG TPA: type II toxin-antitoxin system RelE/ParE family toxin [Rhizomicrobium sp.]|jgi:hypothetical protein